MTRLKYLAQFQKGRIPPELFKEPTPSRAPYLSMEYLRGQADTPEFAETTSAIVAEDNDIILLWDGSNAGEFIRAKRGVVSSTAALVRISNVLPDYFFYLCKSLEPNIRAATVGMGIPHVNGDFVGDLQVTLPPENTQKDIAEFLDRRTGELDQLMIEKQRLLSLLVEKRRALVASFVTQGLNADAPHRDSGIPWLGEIPAHWETWRVGHFAEVGNGSTPLRDNLDYWSGGHIPWLNSAATNNQIIKDANQFVTEQAISECHLPLVQPGSVLVAITGQGKTRGQAALLKFEATINQHVAYVTPKTDLVSSKFLRLWFAAQYDFLRAISDDTGGTKGALTCEQIANLRIAIPPVSEQAAIVDRAQSETNKLDALAEATERTISLLQERRSALISAAVTGQLEGVL